MYIPLKPKGASTILLVAIVGISLISNAAGADFDCKNIKIGNFNFNLSPLNKEYRLSSKVYTPPTYTNTDILINPCGPLKVDTSLPAIDRCEDNTWICRKVTNYKQDRPLVIEVGTMAGGQKSSAPHFATDQATEQKPSEFHWKMDGTTVEGNQWSTDILFKCDTNGKNDDNPSIRQYENGHLKLEWSVPAACASESGTTPDKDKKPDNDKKPDSDNSGSGDGFFSTLFTLIFVCLIIYFGVGMVYNYLSNGYQFWREFPYLCVDFGRYVWDRVSGRNRGGYSVV
ncbi:type II membrane protein [Mycoemilia scoparia]|uniref:Autophagy-related protein 27 n=1 Tax=Mycoemilia scoparia TaxID=417184 RepID=A0A9W8DUX8_9FUNG|nr:type II membrane protein [Mycoemilia scoparia]